MYDEAIDNSRKNYERYILNKIDLPEFRAAQAKTQKAKASLNMAVNTAEVHTQKYRQFLRLWNICEKELPLVDIIDFIEKIVVDEGRRVAVKWVIE